MPKDPMIKKVMVIGSGPIVIGQAAEFDYSGSQACRALREEGVEVVLVNSNPATIMTDTNMADHVYLEPLTADFVTRILKEKSPTVFCQPWRAGGFKYCQEVAHRESWKSWAYACWNTFRNDRKSRG